MTTPEFPAEALDDDGGPRWLFELAREDPNHQLLVVRGLSPAQAVEHVGGRILRHLQPNELPLERPSQWCSLAHGAVDADPARDLLVAGRCGGWTFLYDASGVVEAEGDGQDVAAALSADGRVAASSYYTFHADTTLVYAQDGEPLYRLLDPYNPEHDWEDLPGDLRPAVTAAGRIVEDSDHEDYDANMRIVCALAGLTWTPQVFRTQPLIVAEVGAGRAETG